MVLKCNTTVGEQNSPNFGYFEVDSLEPFIYKKSGKIYSYIIAVLSRGDVFVFGDLSNNCCSIDKIDLAKHFNSTTQQFVFNKYRIVHIFNTRQEAYKLILPFLDKMMEANNKQKE